MPFISATSESISPEALGERLAGSEKLTLLDVREDAVWRIEAASADFRHVPADLALSRSAELVEELAGPIAVVCARGVTAARVARALREQGGNAMSLEGGMRGWIALLQARPVELGDVDIAVRQVQRPGRGCLSYVLASDGHALVVDPVSDAAFYERVAADLDAEVTEVLDTHLHADHVSAARDLAERAGAALRLPVRSIERGVSFGDRVAPVRDGDVLALGEQRLRVLSLPGHTTDMTGLLIEGCALVGGDSLFADGIARPDLELGDPQGARAMARALHATLHQRILALGDETMLLPGHAHPGVRAAALAPSLGEVRRAVEELKLDDPEEFAREVLSGMPPRPANYEEIIAVNAGSHPSRPDLETGANSCAVR